LLLLLILAADSGRTEEDGARAAVLDVVGTLFDGMRAKDETKLRSVFAADARLGTDGVDSFILGVLESGRHLDEVTFDETVLTDGDLAMAWTPYNIFIDGMFHHCGVDLFVLRRGDQGWKITHLDDTRRTDACDPERRT
jgi:hypothetical protein